MTRRPRQGPHRTRLQFEALEAKQLLATFLVTTNVDSGPGSLRQAILDADAQPSSGTANEAIDFAIPGDGVQTIAPASPLPTIDQPTDIDATTQPGYAGSPLIVLDGFNAVGPGGAPVIGLDFTVGNNSTGTAVSGLGIVRFSGSGIETDSYGTSITGVVIGTDVAGGQNLGNGGYGIKFGTNGGNQVSDSVIENNGLRAIGGIEDTPGVPFQSGQYITTSGVVEDNNDTEATELVISTTQGAISSRDAQWGSSLTLEYTVTNTGPIAATDVSIALNQNPFSPILSVTSATTTQGTIGTDPSVDGNYPTFATLGTMAPGASATITVTVQVGPEGDQPTAGQLSAVATSPQLDYFPPETGATYDINASATGQATTSLALSTPTGTVDDEYAQWGSVVTLAYTITNTGPIDATDVTIAFAQAEFSDLLTVTSATTTQGTIGTDLSLDDDHPAFASLGTLAPGASATITLTAQVSVDEAANDALADIITIGASSPQLASTSLPKVTEYTIIPNATGQAPTPTSLPSPTTGQPGPPSTPRAPTSPITLSTPTTTTLPVTPIEGTTASPPTITIPIEITPTPAPTNVGLSQPTTVGVPPQADLVVSATAPIGPRVGAASLFKISVKDSGTASAADAVAAVDLGGLPAGSFYSILSEESTGGSGTLKPVAGRPGVYLVDLGSIAAGASATIAVMVISDAAGPIGLSVAASDAANPQPAINPGGHFASASSLVVPSVQVDDVEVPAAKVIQLYFDSALTKAQADDLNNYRLTASGSNRTQSSATVRLRSATYDAANHRVTLRLAHPLPVTASGVRLSISGLGATGNPSTTLNLPRKQPKR